MMGRYLLYLVTFLLFPNIATSVIYDITLSTILKKFKVVWYFCLTGSALVSQTLHGRVGPQPISLLPHIWDNRATNLRNVLQPNIWRRGHFDVKKHCVYIWLFYSCPLGYRICGHCVTNFFLL